MNDDIEVDIFVDDKKIPLNPKIVSGLFADLYEEKSPSYKRLYWWIHRQYSEWKYFFKKIYQRIRYGFPLEQSWNFKHWHSVIVIPRLKYLRDHHCGHPNNLKEEEWPIILDQMIWAFEHHDDYISPIYSDDYDHRFSVKKLENGCTEYTSMNTTGTIDWSPVNNHHKQVQDGLDLFAKYYLNLWD